MKSDNIIKGISGNLFVHKVVNDLWKSDWNKFEQENDDGIDGTIHIRKKGEWTGEVIYAQIKAGDGYKVETRNRPGVIGIQLSQNYIESHRLRWEVLKGAVILVFVGDDEKAYWTDLKSENSYTTENKSIILINRQNRFGLHSKGHFKKIAGFFPEDRKLVTIKLKDDDIKFIRIDKPIKNFAREFYREWSKSPTNERTNKLLGEIIINRVGWRHISRKSRGYLNIYHSWMLLCVAKKMIQEVDSVFEFRKSKETDENGEEYQLNSFYSLRAKVIFPNRQESVVQVVVRGYRKYNKDTHLIEQRNWFYSVWEPRRGINIQ